MLAVQQMAEREGVVGLPHPAIPLPRNLFGTARENSRGLDLSDEMRLASLAQAMQHSAAADWHAAPMLAVELPAAPSQPVRNPADGRDIVGQVREAGPAEVEAALRCAVEAAAAWAATLPIERAAALERAAEQLEADTDRLVGLLTREAGKTGANAVAEVREAVDFLRYYALQLRRDFDNEHAPAAGPGAVHQPVELPAGHLHRPGGGGAGRRQRGAGQAGRADAAGRGRGGARAARRPACRAARCSCCPAAARSSARRWRPTRA